MRGEVSRLIFVDSSCNTDGRAHSKIMVPPHPFSSVGAERMSLTLVSFTMRRNWYNINNTNNRFYIYVNNVHHEVKIDPGVYTTFDELRDGVVAALNVAIAGIAEIQAVSADYNELKRLFAFGFSMAGGFTTLSVEVRCFAIKSGALPPGVSLAGGFNDVHEILGATPIRNNMSIVNSMTGVLAAGVNFLSSKYPAALNTLDAIYLHMNTINTGNFMSSGYEVHTVNGLRLIESSIFARIPFDTASFTDDYEVVSYEDSGGDMYQTYINRSSIETLDVRVTEARGRSLATLSPNQAVEGLLGFRMALRWDLFSAPPSQPQRQANILEQPPKM